MGAEATDARFALLFATYRLALRELTAAMVEGPGPLAPVALAEPQPLCGSSIDSESTPPETPNNAAPAAPAKSAPPAEAPATTPPLKVAAETAPAPAPAPAATAEVTPAPQPAPSTTPGATTPPLNGKQKPIQKDAGQAVLRGTLRSGTFEGR